MPRFSSLVNLLPQQNNFSCRIKSPSTAATKGAALRTPYVFTSNTLCLFLKDPMSLSQTPYVFSLKTCAPTRYTCAPAKRQPPACCYPSLSAHNALPALCSLTTSPTLLIPSVWYYQTIKMILLYHLDGIPIPSRWYCYSIKMV